MSSASATDPSNPLNVPGPHTIAKMFTATFAVATIPLVSLLWTTVANGAKRLNVGFLTHNMTGVIGGNPTAVGGYGGVLHAIIGTLEITLGAMAISIPIGVMCAVYLRRRCRGARCAARPW